MEQQVPDKVIERIQKILALGRRGGTEAESAAAMEKAQTLLAEYNLSIADVDSRVETSARREQAAQSGGQYVYQRELWSAIARLNFCIHLVSGKWAKVGRKEVYRRQHVIVGKVVNVQMTIAMGTYLEDAANRLCRERLEVRHGAGSSPGELNSQFYSSWAVGFREGVSDRVIEKIEKRRQVMVDEETRRAREAARAGGGSSSTALTLGSLAQQERDLNIDFLYGNEPGTTARERAERAAAAARAEAEYTAWAAAHPEEARRDAEKARKERERSSRRYRAAPTRKVNGSGYNAGYEAGEKVGIDPQATARETRRLA